MSFMDKVKDTANSAYESVENTAVGAKDGVVGAVSFWL